MGINSSMLNLFRNIKRERSKQLKKAQQFYQNGSVEKAIEIWTKLSQERHISDLEKLTTFGWLAVACYATGHYREMATWSARQLRLARQIRREPLPHLKTSISLIEALLNVSRSELGQGNLARAAFFAAEALIAAGDSADLSVVSSNGPTGELSAPESLALAADCRRLSGFCHLVAALAGFGEGNTATGLEHLDRSLLVARQCGDQLLELYVQMTLAQLFMSLKDYNRALHYCGRCENMARNLQPAESPDVTACRRNISLYYGTIMRKLGRPDYAETIAQELLGDVTCTRDPSFQAKCFVLLGDLARSEGQCLRAYSLYENAYSLMRQSGSRFGELNVLLQLAKCLLRMRDNGTVCECKAVEVLQRCCLFARSSNANMIRIRSLSFLEKVLTELGDSKAASVTREELKRLRTTIGMMCAICRQAIGDRQCAISILPCAHLAHDTCLLQIQQENTSGTMAQLAVAGGSTSCSNTPSQNVKKRNDSNNGAANKLAVQFESKDNTSAKIRATSCSNLNTTSEGAQTILKCVHCTTNVSRPSLAEPNPAYVSTSNVDSHPWANRSVGDVRVDDEKIYENTPGNPGVFSFACLSQQSHHYEHHQQQQQPKNKSSSTTSCSQHVEVLV